MKIEKKMLSWKFRLMYRQQIFVGTHFLVFTKKNEKGKEKVVFQGEDTKGSCATSIRGGMSIINRIRRSKLKGKIVVEVGGNQKAISGGMGRVFCEIKHSLRVGWRNSGILKNY